MPDLYLTPRNMERIEAGCNIHGGFHLSPDCSGLLRHHTCPIPRPVVVYNLQPATATVAYKAKITIAGIEVGNVCSLCFNQEMSRQNQVKISEALKENEDHGKSV